MLVDAQFLTEDVDALAEQLERTGTRLSTIIITHGHADHWFGLGRLSTRFPGARPVARPEVVSELLEHRDLAVAQWDYLFGDRVAAPTATPEPIESAQLGLDGHAVRLVPDVAHRTRPTRMRPACWTERVPTCATFRRPPARRPTPRR